MAWDGTFRIGTESREPYFSYGGNGFVAPEVDWGSGATAYAPLQGDMRNLAVTDGMERVQIDKNLLPEGLRAVSTGYGYRSANPFQVKQVAEQKEGNFALNSLGAAARAFSPWLAGATAGALSGALSTGAAGAAGAGTSGVTAADVAAGMVPEFGTNAAYNAAMGLGGTGAGGTAVDMTGFKLDPFGYTPEFNYSLGTSAPGEFTMSQLPGGNLSQYGATGGGMVDLGGAGAIAGVTDGASSMLTSMGQQLAQKIGTDAAKSVLGRMMNGTATADDYAKIATNLGAAALGAFGSNQQAKAFSDLAARYEGYGAPSRARFEASMTPGFDPTTIPGYSGALDTASKAILARLSASGGNPFGSPGALIDANKAIVAGTALPAIQEYQRTNLAAGGLANMNAAVPSLSTASIGSEGKILDSLGYGLQQLTAPKQLTAEDLIKAFGMQGLA